MAQPAEITLLCLPHAGGNGSIFQGWHARLAPGVRVASVNLPGRAGALALPPIERIEDAVGLLVEEIERFLPGPLALYGHSLGGLIAFELARALERRGRDVPGLIIAGVAPPADDGDERGSRRVPLDELNDAALIDELREFGGTPELLLQSDELMRLVLPAIRADFHMARSYRLVEAARLSCPMLLLAGRDDDMVAPNALRGWSFHTTGTSLLQIFDGDHFFTVPHEMQLCASIAKFLATDRSAAG